MRKNLAGHCDDSRLKIAIVPHPQNVFPPTCGSVASVVWAIARRLAASCEVTIFSRRQPPLEKQARVEGVNLRRAAVTLDEKIVWSIVWRLQHYLGLEKFALFRSYFYFAFMIKIALLIRRQRCEIIHLHNYAQFAPILRWFNPASKIILHMHCHWLVEIDWNTIARRLAVIDLVISPSASITEQTRRRFPRAARKCVTVPNGVDTEFFSRRHESDLQELRHRYGLQDKDVILFVGRLTPEKGVHVLLEAMARVQKVAPGAVLVLAGIESMSPVSAKVKTDTLYRQFEEMKKDYHGFLGDLNARHRLNVVFAGFQPHEELVKFYSIATLVVLPSFEEAGPLPVLEAMSCETPIVATSVDGVKDYVPAQAGFLVPPNDPAALAERILHCLNARDLCRTMGQYGRQWVESRLTWDHVVNSLLPIYNRLVLAPEFQEPVYETQYAA